MSALVVSVLSDKTVKICTKCKQEVPILDMERRKDRKDGIGSWCKRCKHTDRARYRRSKDYKKHNLNYYYRNKELWKSYKAKRRAIKQRSLIEDYKSEIKSIYLNCPAGYEVDHIIPLVNDIVCGLHVPWNLQYLTRSENRTKGNKYTVT